MITRLEDAGLTIVDATIGLLVILGTLFTMALSWDQGLALKIEQLARWVAR